MIPSPEAHARAVRTVAALFVGIGLAAATAAEPSTLLSGDADALDGWSARSFAGETRYRVTTLSSLASLSSTASLTPPSTLPTLPATPEVPAAPRCGDHGVEAYAEGSASGRFLELDDPRPAAAELRWDWRVDAPVPIADETSRAGDDFAARVYVMFSGGFAFWRTTSLVYVWADDDAPQAPWANPYTAQAMMFALRRGGGGRWQSEVRDIEADYRAAFGRAPPDIVAVAIMSDTDQTGASASAAYACMTLTDVDG